MPTTTHQRYDSAFYQSRQKQLNDDAVSICPGRMTRYVNTPSTFLTARDYYGADYVVYDYYGDWVPAFPAYDLTGDYAAFYRYDDYDYPYEYNGTVYYITSVWAGYMYAYE